MYISLTEGHSIAQVATKIIVIDNVEMTFVRNPGLNSPKRYTCYVAGVATNTDVSLMGLLKEITGFGLLAKVEGHPSEFVILRGHR